MNVVVTIEKINEMQQFTTKKGDVFKKHSFIGKTQGQYPKPICFSCTNEDVWGRMNLKVGSTYDIFFDVYSKEWNGKWFTEVNAWKASDVAGIPQSSSSQPAQTNNDEIPF